MANLKDIRRRIESVKNTQKVTRSMKMVSGAKLRRAEEAASRSRPYASQLDQTIAQLIESLEEGAHPLITPRETVKNVEWIVIGSDRGLCGSFNAQVLRIAEPRMRAQRAEGKSPSLVAVGRKARDHFRRNGQPALCIRHEGVHQPVNHLIAHSTVSHCLQQAQVTQIVQR